MNIEIDKTIEGIKINKLGKEYVSNPALLKLIIISREKNELTSEALNMLMLMVENISSKKVYPSEEEREDCLHTALLDILLYWKGFNPETGNNPFAYFTSLITMGLAKGWNQLHPENKKAKGCIFSSLDNNIYSI